MKYNKKALTPSFNPRKLWNHKANGRSSDLLPDILPSQSSPFKKVQKSGFDLNTVIELTAAGQLRNYTVFPFNPDRLIPIGNQKRCKGTYYMDTSKHL